jgi:hypothetical protein
MHLPPSTPQCRVTMSPSASSQFYVFFLLICVSISQSISHTDLPESDLRARGGNLKETADFAMLSFNIPYSRLFLLEHYLITKIFYNVPIQESL